MAIEDFPPVDWADENGLLAVGGDLEVQSLLLAYRRGIFPWPLRRDMPLTWFSPPRRAVVFLSDVRLSRSLKREIRKSSLVISVDRDVKAVIRNCAESPHRKGQSGTWITSAMEEAYLSLHCAGYCHSIECYRGPELVGGLYGVSIGAMFAGESMFYLQDNASKICFAFLVQYLRERGVKWLDCQQLTPVVEGFGAVEIERGRFLGILEEAVGAEVELFFDIRGKDFVAKELLKSTIIATS